MNLRMADLMRHAQNPAGLVETMSVIDDAFASQLSYPVALPRDSATPLGRAPRGGRAPGGGGGTCHGHGVPGTLFLSTCSAWKAENAGTWPQK